MSRLARKKKVPVHFYRNYGGLNLQSSLYDAEFNQFRELENVLLTPRGGIIPRKGQTDLYTTAPSGDPEFVLLREFSRTVSGVTTRKMVAMGDDGKLYDCSTDPPTVIGTGFSTTRVPDFAVVRGWLLIVDGSTTPKKWDMTNLYNWGITKPASAPTPAVGGAGNPNGSYRFAVTFRRGDSGIDPGHESSLGIFSASITATSEEIDLTGIPVSADSQVDSRNVYVEIAGEWHLVSASEPTIGNNIDTTYTYDGVDSSVILNKRGRFDRDPPDDDFQMIEQHNDIIFGSNGHSLKWTPLEDFESFSGAQRNSNAFGAHDGTNITGLASSNDFLVFKERSTWIRTGDDLTYTVEQRDTRRGIHNGARHSIIRKDDKVFGFSHEGFMVFDGEKTHVISENIEPGIFGAATELLMVQNDPTKIQGAPYHNNENDLLVWAIPTAVGASARAFVYGENFVTIDGERKVVGTWALWSNLNARSLAVARDSVSEFDILYSGTSDGFVRSIDDGVDDVGSAYTVNIRPVDTFSKDPVRSERLRDAFFSADLPDDWDAAPTVEWYIAGSASGVTKTLSFSSATSPVFDTAIFDTDVFPPEGSQWAAIGYGPSPFRRISPRISWSVTAAKDRGLIFGWTLRFLDAGYRRGA